MKADILNLSEEFCGACNMYHIQPVTALQFYVSKSTIYSTLVKKDDAAFALAKIVFQESCKLNDEKITMDGFKRISGIKYVRQIVKLINSKGSRQDKQTEYGAIIDNWYKDIKSFLPSKIIETSGEFTISLTKDFCILCDLFQNTPGKVLQHYVNYVSITKYFNSTEENSFVYATALFLQYPTIIEQVNYS